MLVLLAACSPIDPISSGKKSEASDAAPQTSSDDRDAASAQIDAGPERVQIGAACGADAMRSCNTDPSQSVLVCEHGSWNVETLCRESERCENVAGDPKCQASSDECVGRSPGVPFCDAEAKMRICIADGTSTVLPCGEHERCQPVRDRVRCGCVPGAILTQSGCEMASSCASQNGGCDPITSCSMNGSEPECGACPTPGYLGDGAKGCEPQLLKLAPSCGTLSPAFSPAVHDYTLRVSVLCQSLQLMASAPAEASLVINGTRAGEGALWQSALLAVGRTTINLNLSTQFGTTATYRLIVDRVGGQEHYLKASNSDAQDVLGLTLAAEGNTVVAGSPWEDSPSPMSPNSNTSVESGAAYVFVSEDGKWTEQALLKASPPTSLEYFGTSVAISGDTIVVGAPSSDPLGVTSLPTMGKGSIYVFVRSGGAWKQQAKLVPKSGPSDDFFGIRVAVQGDTILVGAPFDNDGGSHTGAIYEFTRSAGIWTEGQKIKASTPVAGSLFGVSLVLQGESFVTGAALDPTGGASAGSAYVFVRDAGTWQEQQHLQMPAPVAKATFGWGVALLGDTAMVSAPRAELVRETSPSGEVYVFERSAGRWSQTQVLTAAYPRDADVFGSALALSQSVLVIGANGDASGSRGAAGDPIRSDAPRSGAAVVYAKQGGKWVPTAFLKADNAEAGDIFGESVALTEDALVVAAPFEASAAEGLDSDQSSNAAPRSGALYIYR